MQQGQRKEGGIKALILISSVLVTCALVAVVIVLSRRNAPAVSPDVAYPGAPEIGGEDSAPLFMRPMFGANAVARCSAGCSGRKRCLQACSRLSYSEYARRILEKDQDYKQDAARIIKDCGAVEQHPMPQLNRSMWRQTAELALASLRSKDVNAAAIAQINNRLGYPLDSKTYERMMTVRLIRGSCVQYHALLAEEAFYEAERANDRVSERYFHHLTFRLRKEIERLMPDLENAARSARLTTGERL